jgi:uncharacterized iron-regulated membrane protein
MKFVVKQIVISAVALMLAAPAMATEGLTKGTKSYQAARQDAPAAQEEQTTSSAPSSAEQAAQVAPAAGDTASTQAHTEQGKTMREEMRLPRKNQ